MALEQYDIKAMKQATKYKMTNNRFSFYMGTLIVASLLAASSCMANTVMSFNIRTEHANDPGELAWEKRKNNVVDVIVKANPSVIGLQEASTNQQQYIEDALGPNWLPVANAPILFRGDMYRVLATGAIELVEDKWEKRFAYWVRLEEKNTNKSWLFITTHWGVDEASQLGSAEILLNALPTVTKNWQLPVVLVGDFNAEPNSEPYLKVVNGSPLQNNFWGLTFTGFKPKAIAQLDYAWAAGLTINKCKADRFEAYTTPASDHYPIICEFKL
ncbi:endonuclease/exonuclease/phosphatase family protein [Saccharophagus degradans]|uniref:Endonuclease/exonuclease/phosphatase family protein n=1 Tax=Saccharophagus degradans TaxID=86304 RepID=A0AAW7X574_9GAMM|nr:endonuclease/exonuclease/phosphatase family protein [Saccharophagus degradans]MDO6421678.1 endonuclease/exonuclease/phosphatase family protein [Saccharophagus degradans]MDO6608640.1 endonuclease/exonuclease/phosphatase family protein [Saccharophagus degradans]